MFSGNRYSNDKIVNGFGLKIHNEMVLVDARVLPPPTLKYNDNGEQKSCKPSVGVWDMKKMKMLHGGTVNNWSCLNFSKTPKGAVNKFCDEIVAMCIGNGMVFKRRPCLDHTVEDPKNLEVALRSLPKRFMDNRIEGKLDLVIIILPENSGSYGRIKKVLETELGLVSQCCLSKNVSHHNNQYMVNISLKINVKVGGCNTVLEHPLILGKRVIPYLTDLPTIIFGADVTHPANGDDSSPSIAALVASMAWPQLTKYQCVVSAQRPREEIIEDLFTPEKGKTVAGGMFRELMLDFNKSTNIQPDRIIFYRDGVGEGQFSHVLSRELGAIKKACATLHPNYSPKITIVAVQKRHRTRLFAEKHGRDAWTDKNGNIIAGTVVDRKICHPTEFDFYLCSHASMNGTTRPTHYHILYDENNISADGFQTLTNNLCYTFARCTRSVSIVPAVYYAHLAAFRARLYIEADRYQTSTSLGDRPRESPVAIQKLPEIQKELKGVMFYI